ncbi:ribose-phosphate diphosphokinase [Candidatus Micrarchaeota archaeon]|nr:ribose-phosphate diphosphokinase [Candidatus Micrarchaeota archaeon]
MKVLISPNFKDMYEPNLEIKQFPDGDTYTRIPQIEECKGEDVILLHRLYPEQNTKLMELIFLLEALKKAKSIVLIAPYLPYSRQDKLFKQGEVKSAEIICSLLREKGIEKLITFDCHFLKKEGEFEYGGLKIKNISLNKEMAEHAKEYLGEEFEVISPDQGASYLVEEFGGESMKKVRGEYNEGGEAYRTIEKMEFSGDVKGKNILIMDDMISTGSTMFKAIENLQKAGAKKILCASTHGFFLKDSLKKLKETGVFVSDTIPSEVSEVSIKKIIEKIIKGEE